MEWTFRLRGPKGKNGVLKMSPTATLEDFEAKAVDLLGFKTKKKLTYRSGFPPRAVTFEGKKSVQDVFTNNDTIVVDQPLTSAASAKVEKAEQEASTKSKSWTQPPTSMTKSKGKAGTATQVKTGIHSLNSKSKASASNKRKKITGCGFVLGNSIDEESIEINPNTSQEDNMQQETPTKYRRTKAINLTSKDDVATKLIHAVSGGGGASDRSSKFFRAVTKKAVEHQYEMTLANARLQAALGRKFEIQVVKNVQRLGETEAAVEMKVRFKEGPRKWKEEVVQMLQPIELQAILKYVAISGGETGREMLKPFNMAQCSTRVFWNVARLYDGDVEKGIAELVPDEDWSYLDVRTRRLSAKALEAKANLEYAKQLQQGSYNDIIEIDGEEKQKNKNTCDKVDAQLKMDAAKYAVAYYGSQAPKQQNEPQNDQQARKEAVARATESRLAKMERNTEISQILRKKAENQSLEKQMVIKSNESKKQLLEEEVEELEEEEEEEEKQLVVTVICDTCNKVRMIPSTQAQQAEIELDPWNCEKLSLIDRQGGCRLVDDEVELITGPEIGILLEQCGIKTRKDLANSNKPQLVRRLTLGPIGSNKEIIDELDSFIEQARLEEVDDLMLDLVDGDDEVLKILNQQKLGTPGDLLKTPPDLIRRLFNHLSEEKIKTWQAKAAAFLQKIPWLDAWRSL